MRVSWSQTPKSHFFIDYTDPSSDNLVRPNKPVNAINEWDTFCDVCGYPSHSEIYHHEENHPRRGFQVCYDPKCQEATKELYKTFLSLLKIPADAKCHVCGKPASILVFIGDQIVYICENGNTTSIDSCLGTLFLAQEAELRDPIKNKNFYDEAKPL